MAAIATAGARAAGAFGNKKPRRWSRLFQFCYEFGDQRVTTTVVPTETRL
ncbi:hypothetical protein ABIF66_002365 [Bradyrhizobium japonicum]